MYEELIQQIKGNKRARELVCDIKAAVRALKAVQSKMVSRSNTDSPDEKVLKKHNGEIRRLIDESKQLTTEAKAFRKKAASPTSTW